MNLVIMSPGRRVEIVSYFKEALNAQGGKVITVDMSPYSPALYFGDEHYCIEKDLENPAAYMNNVIELCKARSVSAILTLIDPELVLLAQYCDEFHKINVTPIISDKKCVQATFDKYEFYKMMKDILPVIPTWNNVSEAKEQLSEGTLAFPLFAKPARGSGSEGLLVIKDEKQLTGIINLENYIIQPYCKKNEYGVDIYIDMCSKQITSYFIKKKLNMRCGETDKSVSVHNETIRELIFKLEGLGFLGPIDMDVFEDEEGRYYVNEINPRFGGGYPHAYHCGIDFISKLRNNLQGTGNKPEFGNYEDGVLMMKYNGLFFKDKL